MADVSERAATAAPTAAASQTDDSPVATPNVLFDDSVPIPERITRSSSGGRRYGSAEGVAVGDIVEVYLDGAWSDEPHTVITSTDAGKFVVKQGVAGAPDFSLPGQPRWSSDIHIGTVPELLLSFPEDIRPGMKFKEVLDAVPLPTYSRQRVILSKESSYLVDAQLTGAAAGFALGAACCSGFIDRLNVWLECGCCGGGAGNSSGGW